MKLPLTRLGRLWLVLLIAAAGVFTVLVLPPLQQSQDYHQFADHRPLLGIPSFLNVVSNVGFLIVGLMGMRFLYTQSMSKAEGSFLEPSERLPYAVFFLGALLTGLGSAYYHWTPTDTTLTWDRLPMTLMFMAILAATVVERADFQLGLWLLGPLVVAGAATVWWWRWTGNLWPYAAAQYFSIFLVILLYGLFPPRYTRSAELLGAAAIYGVAKAAEALDATILGILHLLSGHTLKHLIAAAAVFWVLRVLRKRVPLTNANPGW